MSTPATPKAAFPLLAGWRPLVDDVTRLFANVGFAVSLFAVWGVLTLIGVIVDQGKDPSEYFAAYPASVARLVLRLHFDNVYHSAQYVGIIGLILTSLAVCTFKRVIPARLPALRPVKIEHIPLHATVLVRGREDDVRSRIERFFKTRGWTVRKREFGGTEWAFADRHNWARRGVLVAHIGFVIIATGTTIYWARGFSGSTTVLSGAATVIPRTGARIALDRFNYRIDPIQTKSGTVYQPIDYVSDVHVIGHDGVVHPMTIRVNHPIDVDGTLYYQATYGFATSFSVTKDGKPVAGAPENALLEGGTFDVAGTGRTIRYRQFAGNVERGPNGLGIGPDPRPKAPGVVLDVFENDDLLGSEIVPFGQALDLGAGYRVEPLRYTLYSGLQYRYDPGIPLVGIGAFVLLAGLCISFYLLPARLYVRVAPASENAQPGRWAVGLAATTVKGADIFEEQFRDLVAALERDLCPPGRTTGGQVIPLPAT